MKKKWLCLVLATVLVLAVGLSGCQKDKEKKEEDKSSEETLADDDEKYKYTEDVSEYITLPESYKGIEVSGYVEVTDQDVKNEINLQRYFNRKHDALKEGTVEEKTYVNITSVGTLVGQTEPFETQEYDFQLGKGEFLPDFEHGLIGMSVGETKTITLTFPEDYGNEEFNGKEASFVVTLNCIYTPYYTPDWTDELASELSNGAYETTEAFEKAVKEQLQTQKNMEIYYTQQADIIEYLVENTEVHKLPDGKVDECYEAYMKQYQEYSDEDYESLEEYITYETDCDTLEEFENEVYEDAYNTIVEQLVYQAIGIKEKVSLNSLEYSNYLKSYASNQGYSDPEVFEEQYTELYGEDQLWQKFLNDKILECLLGEAEVGKTITAKDLEQ